MKAANSVDLDLREKLTHALTIEAEINAPFSVGLIVGASGSGKTTLARAIYGDDSIRTLLRNDDPIIEQLPASMSYDDCVNVLTGVGLSSVSCWVRPAATLSNGQRARAECALHMCDERQPTVLDEWTSVVDRTVAKAMSHCIAKHARRTNARVVLLSCHYDVIEWLNPDWIIDCNAGTFTDRRLLQRDFKRTEQLQFEIRECTATSWRMFSKYHYLSGKLPGGARRFYGLYHDNVQIGFQCFAQYVSGQQRMYHSNRTVIHPDYVGLGLGMRLIDATSHMMAQQRFDVRATFTSLPVYKAMNKRKWWQHTESKVRHSITVGKQQKKTFRLNVLVHSFKFNDAVYMRECA